MSVSASPAQISRFKIGWIILLVMAALMVLMHFGLIFALGNFNVFFGFTVLSVYAFIVILIPFRRLAKWAWVATWLFPIALALPGLADPAIGIYYIAFAVVCVVGLLLTMSDFFAKK